MRAQRWLCRLGLHDWRTVRIQRVAGRSRSKRLDVLRLSDQRCQCCHRTRLARAWE